MSLMKPLDTCDEEQSRSRHALDAEHYCSNDSFRREQRELFGKRWIFAGFSGFLKEKNQFVAREIAGRAIVLQRTGLGIEAFLNECPHRLSKIQVESCGKRPLICPYHGWSFAERGALAGLPNEWLYNFSEDEKSRLCLRKLGVQVVGQLVFVNFSRHPEPIEKQFSSDFLESLAEFSSCLDDQIAYACFPVAYNWKLNIENVKDFNHVPFVHPRTFYPEMIKSPPPVERPSPIMPGLLASGFVPEIADLSYRTKASIQPRRMWFEPLIERFGSEDVYYNYFIYPNVNFCSVRGDHFLLQQYDPSGPGETKYHLWMMTARRKDKRTDFTALLRSLISGERYVIEEDAVYLNALQANLETTATPMVHGDYEVPLVNQHLWYRAHVLGEGRE